MFDKFLLLCVCGFIFSVKCDKETVLMTEVFEIQVYPQIFNWTFEGLFIIYVLKILDIKMLGYVYILTAILFPQIKLKTYFRYKRSVFISAFLIKCS